MTFLLDKEVLEIRRLYHLEKWTQSRIAKKFKIDQSQVSRIVNNKQWVKDESCMLK